LKTLTSAMIGYLQSDTQTFNTCWSIALVNGTNFYFTDCDQPIVFGGHSYSPIEGYSPSNVQSSDAYDVDHVEVTSFLDASGMTEADVMAGLWDDAKISMFMVNRLDLTAGAYHMRDGVIGQITITSPGQFTAELRGLTQYIQKTIGYLVSPTCRWTLGDVNAAGPVAGSHCTINLAALAVTGAVVTSVVNNQSFAASGLTALAGYFTSGFLKWTGGLNAERPMDIQAHGSSGAIVLQVPMLNLVQVGDVFTIYPGCQKRLQQDCITKFSNGINFGGFPYLPGIDKMLRPGGI
jgi:uncharacterized phage protein (TIGR02218 family)